MPVALVTGANGFIGRHLVARLAGRNYQVAALGNSDPGARDVGAAETVSRIDAELSSANLDRIAGEAGVPEVIFHLAGGASVGAAFADPRRDYLRTVDSTSILLEWMRNAATASRLVAVSSAAVYGAGHDGPIPESAQCHPYSPYGTHKLMMEFLCRCYSDNFGLSVVMPRLFSVYGPGLRKQLLWDLCSKFAAGGQVELGGSGDELRDWTEVDDVISGLEQISALADDSGRVINLATGRATPVRDIATLVAQNWGGAEAVSRLRFSGRARDGDPFSLVADTGEMRALGIECSTMLERGIEAYVTWFREHAKRSR